MVNSFRIGFIHIDDKMGRKVSVQLRFFMIIPWEGGIVKDEDKSFGNIYKERGSVCGLERAECTKLKNLKKNA